MNAGSQVSSYRIPELDGIRGLAIALVLYCHFVDPFDTAPATFFSYVRAAGRLSFTGVDLFFVLSGFLIGGILLDARAKPDYFRTFYTRRLFRIVPIYAALLGVATLFIFQSGITQQVDLRIGPWFLYPLFLQNFWMAKANMLGFLGITWSLAVEEQFYLTLPTIVRYFTRGIPYIVASGIIAAPLVRTLLFYHVTKVGAYVLTIGRSDALLLGMAGAMLVRNASCNDWLRHHGGFLWGAVVALLAGACVFVKYPQWITDIPMRSVGFTMIALLYLGILLIAVTHPQSWLAAGLRFKPLRWLGAIAYGLYLLHYPLLLGIKFIRPQWPVYAVVVTSVLLTFTLATLSWHFFEKPLIYLGHRLSS